MVAYMYLTKPLIMYGRGHTPNGMLGEDKNQSIE